MLASVGDFFRLIGYLSIIVLILIVLVGGAIGSGDKGRGHRSWWLAFFAWRRMRHSKRHFPTRGSGGGDGGGE